MSSAQDTDRPRPHPTACAIPSPARAPAEAHCAPARLLANSGMDSAGLPHVRLFVDAPLAAGVAVACSPEQANYLGNVLRLPHRGRDTRFQRARWRMARTTYRRGQAEVHVGMPGAVTPATGRPRCALSLRAAEACASRLHGAEGGRTGRCASAAGVDAPHRGITRQPGAHDRQRHRGGRAVRRAARADGRRTGEARAAARRMESAAAADFLR